jgi:hypothetical protein
MDTYFKFSLHSLRNYLYSIGDSYGYDDRGNTWYGSDLEEMRRKGLIILEFPMKHILFGYGILGYIRECPDGTWLAHHCSTEIEILGFVDEFYAVLYLHQLDNFQDSDDEIGGIPKLPWEQFSSMYQEENELKKLSISPIAICSFYRKRAKKIKSAGNTKIFLDMQNEQRKYLSNLIVLRDNEELLVVSMVDGKKWLVLSNYGMYYSVDSAYKLIDYYDVLSCSADGSRILVKGYSAYSEKSWDVEITKVDGEKNTVNIADVWDAIGIITNLINWLSLYIRAPVEIANSSLKRNF